MESEIEGYGGKVQELVSESQTLLNREHFDGKTIQKKQVYIMSIYQLSQWYHNIFTCKFVRSLFFIVTKIMVWVVHASMRTRV